MLIGKKIKLRALEPIDLDVIYEWENDSSIWMFSNTFTPFSRYTLKKYLLNSHKDIYSIKQMRLIIEIIESTKAIGCIDLFDFDPHNLRAGIGILIGEKNERKKGYASEALELLINYSFTTLNLHQLYCNILSDNEHSMDLFKKHNFQIAGLKKDWVFSDKKWYNEYLLQLIR